MPERDWSLKIEIENVLNAHPSYGHRRIAQALRGNKKRVLRVMHVFGIEPYRRRAKKRWKKRKTGEAPYPNLLLTTPFPKAQNQIWVSDFTELRLHGKKVYVATIMDLYTREIRGWNVLTAHTTELVLTVLQNALAAHPPPVILHSDQGSEYTSKEYTTYAESCGIHLSMSRTASPWENGYQESFYSQFKLDLGDPNRYDDLGQLVAAIAEQIRYYMTERIHSSLKMPPAVYARRHEEVIEKVETPA